MSNPLNYPKNAKSQKTQCGQFPKAATLSNLKMLNP